jgi:hypothetical protein
MQKDFNIVNIKRYIKQILINDCSVFNDKTNLKMKWKGKQDGGNFYIALYKD